MNANRVRRTPTVDRLRSLPLRKKRTSEANPWTRPPSTRRPTRAGTHLTVYLSGELDAACDEILTARVLPHIHPGDEVVWVDMSAVTFCGSSGISLLLRILDLVEAGGGRMTVYRPSRTVTRVLELCQVDQHLSIRQPQTVSQQPARRRAAPVRSLPARR